MRNRQCQAPIVGGMDPVEQRRLQARWQWALRPHEVVMDIDRPAVPFLIVDIAERRADVGVGQVSAEGQHPVDPHRDVLILGQLIEIAGNATVERRASAAAARRRPGNWCDRPRDRNHGGWSSSDRTDRRNPRCSRRHARSSRSRRYSARTCTRSFVGRSAAGENVAVTLAPFKESGSENRACIAVRDDVLVSLRDRIDRFEARAASAGCTCAFQ